MNCFRKNLAYSIHILIKFFGTIILLAIIIFSACEEEKQPEVPKTLNEKMQFSYPGFANTLTQKFIDNDWSSIFKDSLFQYYDTLKSFYLKRNYTPLFITSFEEKGFVDSLLNILGKADEHGLNPDQYHINQIKDEFAESFHDTIANYSSYSHLADTELLISDAILKYSFHLRYGLVNPKKIFSDSYFLPAVDSAKKNLFEPLYQKNILNYLQDIQPKSKRYKNLQTALERFEKLRNLNWNIILFKDRKYEEGEKDSVIIPIIDRLIVLGLIDTSQLKIKDYSVYDSTLVKSIKDFQLLNGLNDDGVIGKNTIEKLNTTPQEYINKIKLNLERFRWNNYPDTSTYVMVNIPDFRLFIVNNGKNIFSSKVCVGRKRPSYYAKQLEKYKKTKKWEDEPEDWETPEIYSNISYLVLNPTWSVPESIVREEIFQKVSEDSMYLLDHNFKVYLDTTEVDPSKIALKDLSTEEINYRIIQDPGAGNALGKIKFIFPNRFGIYLHDTPTREPFNYSNRAVSHGCVRVENPMPLAEFLLEGHPKWNIDFLKIEIGQKVKDQSVISEYRKLRKKLREDARDEKTTDLHLSKKVPLYIDYFTTWVDEKGEVNFRNDVYNKDKILFEYLEAEKLIL